MPQNLCQSLTDSLVPAFVTPPTAVKAIDVLLFTLLLKYASFFRCKVWFVDNGVGEVHGRIRSLLVAAIGAVAHVTYP